MFDKLIPIALVGLAIAAVAACGGTEPETRAPSADQGASAPAYEPVGDTGATQGCQLLTEGEAETVLGGPATLSESPVGEGIWCSWQPSGQASIEALKLELAPGEDRFDEAMDRAEAGDGLHDTDPELGPLGFTSDNGQTVMVAWVVDDQSVVLSLTAGDLTADDLVVLAKAVNTRLTT